MLKLIVNQINDVNEYTIYFVWKQIKEICETITVNAVARRISTQLVDKTWKKVESESYLTLTEILFNRRFWYLVFKSFIYSLRVQRSNILDFMKEITCLIQ